MSCWSGKITEKRYINILFSNNYQPLFYYILFNPVGRDSLFPIFPQVLVHSCILRSHSLSNYLLTLLVSVGNLKKCEKKFTTSRLQKIYFLPEKKIHWTPSKKSTIRMKKFEKKFNRNSRILFQKNLLPFWPRYAGFYLSNIHKYMSISIQILNPRYTIVRVIRFLMEPILLSTFIHTNIYITSYWKRGIHIIF